jgi:ribosomal protein L28
MRQCALCAKKPAMAGRLVKLRATKFNPSVKRKQKPNLQWLTLESGDKVKACTKCIKTMARTK